MAKASIILEYADFLSASRAMRDSLFPLKKIIAGAIEL